MSADDGAYRHGFQHGDELGFPIFCCSFCHERGTWHLTRIGDVVTEWPCDEHLVWTLDKLQRREPGSTEIAVRKVIEKGS